MNLKQLAWFYENEVQVSCDQFMARVRHVEAKKWLDACVNNLLRALFAATHKVLIAQYKLIEADISFDDYCQSLRQVQIREYLHERYPALSTSMSNACSGWLTQAHEISERFFSDQDEISNIVLPGSRASQIEQITFGMGDNHRKGRSVAILTFQDGQRLVYKPRSLSVDGHFGDVVAWINGRCVTKIQLPPHIDKGGYGWVQFVEHASCVEIEGIDRFYRRMGILLALLYVLEGTDFHYENIIASGEYPVLIDLESFFCPHVQGADNESLDSSVLKVGILPNRLAATGNIPEISGLSDVEGQLGIEGLHLMLSEDGGVSLTRRRGRLLGSQNVPIVNDTKIQLQACHISHVKAGFEEAYLAVLDDVEGFLATVEAFSGDQVRVLFRHTATYGHLLEEARHPFLMMSLEKIAKHYELLRLGIKDFKPAEKFVEHEITDLHNGDVPLFTARVDGYDLWVTDSTCIHNFFDRSGLEMVKNKIKRLSQQDLERQIWIIGNSFNAHASPVVQDRAETVNRSQDILKGGLEDRLRAKTIELSSKLSEQMHVDADSASWLVHLNASLDNSRFDLIPASYDLMSGMPGEILFFSQLAQVTGDFSHINLAQKALRHLKQQLERSEVSISALGLYAGLGSVLSLSTSLAQLESNYEYLEYAHELISSPNIEDKIENDRSFSLIKGAAGLMVACSELHIVSGSRRALLIAEKCAEHLLAHRCTEFDGYAWRITSTVPLSGLAHGSSGFALAFARLYEASGDVTYRNAALSALEYERSLYHPLAQNWLDKRDIVLREYGDRKWCSVGWAHGAPGIGLARLALLRAGIDTTQIRSELETALHTTLRHGFDQRDSLIFGNFGNLELVISYAECFGEDSLPKLASLVTPILERIERDGLRLSAPTPYPMGLMTGATGVAYQCMRLANLHEIPSVLCGTSRLSSETRTRILSGSAQTNEISV